MTAQAQELAAGLDAILRALRSVAWEQTDQLPVALTVPQVQTLKALVDALRAGESGLSLSELSRRLGLAHSTVSGIVGRLDARGLLKRSARSDDRRFVEITLDPRAQAWVTQDLPDLRVKRLQEALTQATPAQRDAIVGAVQDLAELLASVGS